MFDDLKNKLFLCEACGRCELCEEHLMACEEATDLIDDLTNDLAESERQLGNVILMLRETQGSPLRNLSISRVVCDDCDYSPVCGSEECWRQAIHKFAKAQRLKEGANNA